MTRRFPPVDAFKKSVVEETVKATEPPSLSVALAAPDESQLSIDSGLKNGLKAVLLIVQRCLKEAQADLPGRDTVQSLKDSMSILHELKKREQEILEELSDEDLEKLIKNDNK